MKIAEVETVIWEKGRERVPLFVIHKGRKHKISNSNIINRKQYYMEGKKAVVYNVQVAATRFKLYNDLLDDRPTTRWFVDAEECELFFFNDDLPF